MQNCKLPKVRLSSIVAQGFKVAMATMGSGRIGITSQTLGIEQSSLDITVEYMNVRKQFGKIVAIPDFAV